MLSIINGAVLLLVATAAALWTLHAIVDSPKAGE